MNADEYWVAVIRRNPALDKEDDATIKITIRGLRNLIKQAHETGWDHHKVLADKLNSAFNKSNPFNFF